MADGWNDTPDVGSMTLNDTTANAENTPRETIDPRAGNEELIQLAQDKGWHDELASGGGEEGEEDVQWMGASAKYEWKDEYGDVAPRIPELEEILFGGDFRMKKGSDLEALEFFITVEGPKKIQRIEQFADAALHPVILENIKLCGYEHPTPIQSYCIPVGLQGNDVVAVAQTGSGKTAAYMIPILSRLMGKANKLCAPRSSDPAARTRAEPLVVIVVPARELAIQIFDEARRMCYRSMLRPCVSYGGLPMPDTIRDLAQGCDILIGTPGRLADLVDRPELLSMRRIKFTIIDEADELLNDDWLEQIQKIMGGDTNQDADHSFMLFSATFPKSAVELANEYLTDDRYLITVGRPGSTHQNIKQDVIWIDGERKQEALWDLLMASTPVRTIIFCASTITVDRVDDLLFNRGLPTTSIHSKRSQREREDSLRAFRTGKCPILVTTGVSARGWDIKGVEHVINFDLPSQSYGGIEDYIHRIGRTGRIGNKGLATSFYNERNEDIAKALVNVLIESNCEVPDFLEQFKHSDGQAHFDEEEEEEEGFGMANGEGTNGEGEHTEEELAADSGQIGQAVPVAAGW